VTRADPSTVPAIAAAAAVIMGAYLAVFAITGFDRRERRMLIARLRGLRSRLYVSRA
jgi:hypothetical protein